MGSERAGIPGGVANGAGKRGANKVGKRVARKGRSASAAGNGPTAGAPAPADGTHRLSRRRARPGEIGGTDA